MTASPEPPGIRQQIVAQLPELPAALHAVATYVIDHPGQISGMSVAALARAAGASPAAVTRFCRAVGLSGYQELRLRLAEEGGRLAARQWRTDMGSDIGPEDPMTLVASVVAGTDVLAIRHTLDQLDLGAVDAAARAIAAARRIDVYGVGGSANTARELELRMLRIDLPIHSRGEATLAETSAALLGPDDVAIAISHSGTTRDTVEPLRLAAERGATTVGITNYPRSSLARVADLVLTTAVYETSFRQGGTAAAHSQLLVVDCLYVRTAQLTYRSSTGALARTHDVHARHVLARQTRRDRS